MPATVLKREDGSVRHLLITIDTNLLDESTVTFLNQALPDDAEIATTTVSERERGQPTPGLGQVVHEVAVFGESQWGRSKFASAQDAALHRETEEVIVGGKLPPYAEQNAAQRRQFRDVMVFVAHVRACRHLLITNDKRGFIDHGRREKLEVLGSTRIRTADEVLNLDRAEIQALMPDT